MVVLSDLSMFICMYLILVAKAAFDAVCILVGNYTRFVHFVPERNILVLSSASCGVGMLRTV